MKKTIKLKPLAPPTEQKHRPFCGSLGPIDLADGVSDMSKLKAWAKAQREGKTTPEWKNERRCMHLTTEKYSGPLGVTLNPVCDKGHIVDRVKGASLGRLFRGFFSKCRFYEECAIVRTQLVTRQELEELNFDPEEVDIICGTERRIWAPGDPS